MMRLRPTTPLHTLLFERQLPQARKVFIKRLLFEFTHTTRDEQMEFAFFFINFSIWKSTFRDISNLNN